MAIHQSDWATGKKQTYRPQTAGAVHAQRFEITLAKTVAAADIVELGVLPPYARIVGATLVPEGSFAAITADIGIMSGDTGDTDPTRTSGDELFDGAALSAVTSAVGAEALLLEATELPRSIGVKFSAEVTGATTKKLTLIVFYAQ